MTGGLPTDRLMGHVAAVTGGTIRITAPHATQPAGSYGGEPNPRGTVGEFLIVRSGSHDLLARLTSVELNPGDASRTDWTPGAEVPDSPLGSAMLLATIEPGGELVPGVATMPRLGDPVYSAPGRALSRGIGAAAAAVQLGHLTNYTNITVSVDPAAMFGRHMAILGSTGGGKSWTLARVSEEVRSAGGRILLLDATGEYATLTSSARHILAGASTAAVPVHELADADRRLLFRPSLGSQLPKMSAAIASLRLAHVIDPSHQLVRNGHIVKARALRATYQQLERQHSAVVTDPHAPFDVTKLAEQIGYECVWPNDRNNDAYYGDINQQEIGYCSTLMTRVADTCRTPEVLDFINPMPWVPTLLGEVIDWLNNGGEEILRVDLSGLPSSHHLREITVNTLGERLLKLARSNRFRGAPLIVALDEAHQFLGRTLGDEQTAVKPEAFEIIAKEGRKYGLTLVVATQRPGDIPAGVLSQMGCLVVHRLTERRDQEHIADASSFLDRSLAHTLPTLMPGECLLLGSGLPIPVPVRVAPPTKKPASEGPDFGVWSARSSLSGDDAE